MKPNRSRRSKQRFSNKVCKTGIEFCFLILLCVFWAGVVHKLNHELFYEPPPNPIEQFQLLNGKFHCDRVIHKF